MTVIYDDTHAVSASTVCVVTKADAEQPPPFDSAYFLAVQTTNGCQTLRWTDVNALDEFYKRLIEAMEKA